MVTWVLVYSMGLVFLTTDRRTQNGAGGLMDSSKMLARGMVFYSTMGPSQHTYKAPSSVAG